MPAHAEAKMKNSVMARSRTARAERLKLRIGYLLLVCHLPLYQDKAVTPTSLKDIFTPIWSGPLNRTFPNHRQIVLVGHSMGGILSRLMITDSSGDKVWRYFFGTLPAQTKLSPESKALVREALVFKRRRDVARVI